MRIIKNKAFLSFLVFLTFLVFAVALEKYFYHLSDDETIKRDFVKALDEKEKILRAYLEKLQNEYFSLPDSAKIDFFSEFQQIQAEENISFFIFKDDSAIFWSTNFIPFPGSFPQKKSNPSDIIKLNNGWYNQIVVTDSLYTYAGLILLQHQYSFQNDYLKNSFAHGFRIPEGTFIVSDSSLTNLSSKNKNYFIDLKIPSKKVLSDPHVFILLIVYLSALLCVFTSIYFIYKQLDYVSSRKWLLLLGFSADVILIRIFLFYFKIPSSLYSSPLFGPDYFFSSNFIPSLGDFIVNSIIFLYVSYIFYLNWPYSVNLRDNNHFKRILNTLLLLSVISGGLYVINFVIKVLVLNSTIPFTLQNISSLTVNSYLGFFIISAVTLSFILIFSRLSGFKSIRNFGFSLFLMAIFATISLNYYNDRHEKEKRRHLAVRLSVEGDPFVELLFSKIENILINDPVFKDNVSLSHSSYSNDLNDDSITSKLLSSYFRESWNNYFVQITICRPGKNLRVQPQNYFIDCEQFFQDILTDFAKPTSGKHLFYLDYGDGSKNYLVVVPFHNDISPEGDTSKAYIEINSKLLFKDLGYPELLIDKNQTSIPDIAGYSYAFFRDGKLINRWGSIQYSLDLDHATGHHPEKEHFYTHNGIDHYCYPIGENNYLIISKKANTFLDKIAPFAYLLFFFFLFTMLFFLVVKTGSFFSFSQLQFSERLEISMTGILVISLLAVGSLSVFYITRLNLNKNLENLSERAHSIWIEMQHKVGMADDLAGNETGSLDELLTKFSNVFFSDINLYSPAGRLISTSRPEIFEKGLISPLMNNMAYANLKYAHSTLFIHDEAIGSHDYSSAYVPFYNNRNVLLGYLNLPYFARQDDLKREISTFLMAFINIYVLLIIIGFLLALFASNYVTRPLRLLTVKLGKLTLGKSNDKLKWERNDEVGKLVEEYNRKIDELAKSAEMLARSERESAWREMARQIAHEIKNPLTPMKLSVQFLQKSWDEQPSDWDQRIRRFTSTMIEQIDSLSFIASEFSDFARMPDAKKEQLELNEIIRNAIVLYRNISNIQIIVESLSSEACVIADRKQLLRVFTNLFNNSVEAIGEEKDGWIKICLTTSENHHIITITDNGSGIPPEQAEKIFQPNFTTKSGGMGLGLAIVRNIIISSGGNISFHSDPQNGTIFTISFPGSSSFDIMNQSHENQ